MKFRMGHIIIGQNLEPSLMDTDWETRRSAWEQLSRERRNEIVHQRIRETIEQVVAADKAGFAMWGTQSQHFIAPDSLSPDNVSLFAAIAALTKNIKLRPHVWVLPTHHPINVAERIGFMDIISNGRFEFGVGRGNSWLTADAYGNPITDTYEMTVEALQIIAKACTQFEVEHDGKYFKIPPRHVQPQPKKLPPLWFAAHSMESHVFAGRYKMKLMRMGIPGIPQVGDWETGKQIEAYWKSFEGGESIFPGQDVGDVSGGSPLPLCVEDDTDPYLDELEEMGRIFALSFANRVGASYLEFMRREGMITEDFWNEMQRAKEGAPPAERRGRPRPLTPDGMLAKLREMESMGVTEVTCSVDGYPHDVAMKSIELMGRYVIPKFTSREPEQAAVAAAR